MKNVKVIGWVSILFLLVFASCRKDDIDPITNVTVPDPIVLVEASVFGQVIDENNVPVEDAKVVLNSETVSTDEHGFFEFTKADLNKNGTYIKAEKFGYFLGAKMFNPELGEKSYVIFQLLEKSNTGSFNTSEGGEVETTDNAKVTFGANSIMYDNGTEYTGVVNVAVKWIDPTHETIEARMPGDLRAINAEDERVQLATYGMLAVELETPGGAPLQIKEGETATISMEVPAEILGQAPSSIPLWSFDEATGYWVEESEATLQGNKYIGDVSHFSFWNCDAPFPVVHLSGSVESSAGNPVPYLCVTISNANVGTGNGYTNEEGNFSGKIPKDQTLTIRVKDACNMVIYEEEIGPFSTDVVLDPIVLDPTVYLETTLTGTLLKCDGSPVTNGYAFVDGGLGYQYLYVDENGVFSQLYSPCQDITGTLQGYDLDGPLTSDPIDVVVTTGGGTTDLGDIEVCDVVVEMIHFSVPSLGYERSVFQYTAVDTTSIGEGIYIGAWMQNELSFNIGVDVDAPMQTGIVGTDNFYFTDFSDPAMANRNFYCPSICPEMNITTNDGSGGAFEAVLVGDYIDEATSETHEFTITFDIVLD